jgi:Fur family transcriptional regulator, peroxide stress response regulator
MRNKEETETGNELRQKLETRGAHLTRQRLAVYDYLSRVEHHPTAEDVFLAIKRKLPRISLATVYKNLEALVHCGAISKLTYGDGSARYDIRTDHHYHTRCLQCGSVSDLEPEEGAEFLSQIKPKKGFNVKEYRLELIGLCNDCSEEP